MSLEFISVGAAAALSSKGAPPVEPPNLTRPLQNGKGSLQRLRVRHHNIIRYTAMGLEPQDVANLLNVSVGMVRKTINSELGKQKLEALINSADVQAIDVIKEFNELAPVAIEVVEEIMTDGIAKDSDRLNAAKVVLNGAGYGQMNHLEVNIHHVTDEDIKEAKLSARERSALGPVIEDAEIVLETDGSQVEGS